MPGNPEQCRAYAEMCRLLAGNAPDETWREHFTELAEDDARRGVRSARGWLGHHDAHGPIGPGGLRASQMRKRRSSQCC